MEVLFKFFNIFNILKDNLKPQITNDINFLYTKFDALNPTFD